MSDGLQVPRLHHGRASGGPDARRYGEPGYRRSAQGQLDLHSGARRTCGRLQIFNNWSPYMVADPTTTWIGLEYFCYETDALWKMSDEAMIELAGGSGERSALSRRRRADGTVLRMPKTYPAYFGTYDRFDEIRELSDGFANLYLIGRNGMHKYNNQDHSMLTAMTAVDNICGGTDKANIWDVNTEQEYHEEKT